MTNHPLEGSRLKWERAKQHLEALDAEIGPWPRRKPYRVRPESNAEKTEAILRVDLLDVPPLEWGVVVGDIVHNWRSALDHLAWQLASLSSSPPKQTEFPIFLDRAAYHKASSSGKPLPGGGLYKVR